MVKINKEEDGEWNQWGWNERVFHGAPYWVKNFKGLGQGRIRGFTDGTLEWEVYAPDAIPPMRFTGKVNNLWEALEEVDNWFATEMGDPGYPIA